MLYTVTLFMCHTFFWQHFFINDISVSFRRAVLGGRSSRHITYCKTPPLAELVPRLDFVELQCEAELDVLLVICATRWQYRPIRFPRNSYLTAVPAYTSHVLAVHGSHFTLFTDPLSSSRK